MNSDLFTPELMETTAAEMAPVEETVETPEVETETETPEVKTGEEAVANAVTTANTTAGAANTTVAVANTANVATATSKTKEVTKEPPKERWDTVLANARQKERETVKAEMAWAADIPAEEGKQFRSLLELGNKNPEAFLDTIVRGLYNSPVTRKMTEQYFGRIFGTPAAGDTKSTADDMPQPDIPTSESNGKPVLYSAAQQQKLLDWRDRQMEARFQNELAPFKQEKATIAAQADADSYATRAIATVKTQPGFAENKTEIAAEYEKIAGSKDMTRSEAEKLQFAYLSVVAPKLEAKGRLAAIEDTKRKADASSGDPSAPKGGKPFDYKGASFLDALKHEANIQR